jgi:ABC-type dipeptide/oligopeptide/nickel transport system ATPase component
MQHEPEGVDEIIRRLPKFFTISIASKRGSGKSVLVSEIMRDLLKREEHRVDMFVVMSGSAGLNKDYTDIVPANLIMPFSEAMMNKIWEHQAGIIPEKREHICLVLDDCLGDKDAVRNPTIQKWYSVCRHISASLIVISQHTSVLLTPIIRSNSDLIVYSKLNRQQLETLWTSTTNISKKDFIRVSETLGGRDYNMVVLDNVISSTEPDEFITIVRAKPPAK